MIYRHTYDLQNMEYSVTPADDVSCDEIIQDNAVISYHYCDYVFTMYSESKSEKYFFGKCMDTVLTTYKIILSVLKADIAEKKSLEEKLNTSDCTVAEDIHMRVLKQNIESNTEKLKEKELLFERLVYAAGKRRIRGTGSYRRSFSKICRTAAKEGVTSFSDISSRQTAEEKFKAKKVNREISRLKKRDFKAKYRPNKQKQWYRKHQKNISKRIYKENGK